MGRYTNLRTVVFFIFASLVFSACGGGGDDGGSVNGISVNTSSISLAAEQNGNLPSTQNYEITWTNANIAVVLVGVPPGDSILPWVNLSLSGGASPMTLSIGANTTNLPTGNHSMTLRVVGGDSNDNVINIVDIPVTYTVSAGTVASPTSVAIDMIEGQTPAAQIVNLDNSGSTITPISVAIISGATWFTASINGNDVEIASTTAALSLTGGSQFGTLRIGHANGFTTVALILRVTAQGLTVSANPEFLIDTATQVADLSQDITVGTNFVPVDVVDWSAIVEADKPWVTVLPASGDITTTNTMTVTIDSSQLGDLLNRYNNNGSLIDHTADITLSSITPDVAPVTMTVTLNIDSPHVMNVSPNVAVSGTNEEIILRGWGFADLTNQALNCGAQQATSYTVLSDVEIRATCPALSAGVYEMAFENSIGLDRINASLYVEDAVAYIDEVIATTGTKTRIIYDAIRKSIYVANNGNNMLDRFVFDNTIAVGSQWAADNVAIQAVQDIALSTDGSYLYAGTNSFVGPVLTGSQLHEVDPVDLSIPVSFLMGDRNISSINFLSGGEAIVTYLNNNPVYPTPIRIKRNSAAGILNLAIQNSIAGASRDGRRALLASLDAIPALMVNYFDSASAPTAQPANSVATTLVRSATSISSDRTGSKWIFDQQDIYSDQFILLGTLPMTTITSILSHDGTIAYTIDSAGTGSVRKFDLANVDAMQFDEIGSGATLAADPGNNPVMTISHDGSRLFIVGDLNLLIMEAP